MFNCRRNDSWEPLNTTFGCLGPIIANDIILQQKAYSLFHGKLSELKAAFDYAYNHYQEEKKNQEYFDFLSDDE